MAFSVVTDNFASTRPVQIATCGCSCSESALFLCLHTPRADCNVTLSAVAPVLALCLHTPRADCNRASGRAFYRRRSFASTRPVQIATSASTKFLTDILLCLHTPRADCNDFVDAQKAADKVLCLHTPRADCNIGEVSDLGIVHVLCLHTPRADCNRKGQENDRRTTGFASTRPVQIATRTATHKRRRESFASTRPVQIATAEMHRMQYALFRTCVESVDSFSVLNKAMLR